MQVITETELLGRIREFLERHAMAPTTFGRKATGEPQLISSIESGRSPSLKVANRVMAFMKEHDAALAALSPPPPSEAEERQLPFGQAPVSPTGGSSPICSPTAEPPPSPAASGSCRCSASEMTDAAASPDAEAA